MFKKIIHLHLLLLAFMPLTANFGQKNAPPSKGGLADLDLEMFELPNGEAGNHVQAIVQDRYGFMWFGSQYGLHRWDGNQFKTYLHDPSDPRSISSDYIECIFSAKDGTLWIGTWGEGLNHYDPKTEKFTRYYQARRDGLSDNFVNVVAEDKEGFIWIGTLNGLDRLDPKTGNFTHFRNASGDKNSLSCNQVRALLVDSQGTLWVGTGFFFDDSDVGGLNKYDPKTGGFTRYFHKNGDPSSLVGNEVRSILEDSKGNLWVGTNGDGLHLMNRSEGTFERFQNNRENDNSLSAPKGPRGSDSQTTFILEDSDHRFWLGNWAGGIKCFDPATGEARVYSESKKKGSRLNENAAWTGFQSKDGVRWFSTAFDGARVYRTAGKQGMFKAVYLPTKTDAVKSICEDAQQNILFSTKENLLGKLSPQLPGVSGKPQYNEQDAVLAGSDKIVRDAEGQLWGLKPIGGLTCYDPVKKTSKRFVHQSSNPNSLPNAPVLDVLPDKNGNLWLATFGKGLVFFDKKTERFTALRNEKSNENSLPHDYSRKLFMDEQGYIWVTGGGKDKDDTPFFITRYDPATKIFTRYQINGVPDYTKLWQSTPAQDKAGNIWVCLDAGLLKLSPESGKCNFFDQKRLGQKGNRLKGMVVDNDGRFWILSDKLLAFDPVKETVFSYGVGSGLFTLPFEQDAIYKNERGEIYIGGRNGMHFFDPSQLDSLYLSPPAVRITGFELLDADGPESRYDSSMAQLVPLELKYDENVFTFSFSALDFNDPAANRLEFKLENFDDDWRVAGQDLKATYVKVPPGTYLFRVRGANSFGVWGKETSVVVTILPPWWMTWWAWSLYAMLAVSVIFMAYRFLLNRRMEKAETNRLKELDAVKNRLFANITHEFRTPLTIILGMAEQGKMEIEKMEIGNWKLENGKSHDTAPISNFPISQFPISLISNFDMITRNGTNLLGLVNQMLELAKMENGTVEMNIVQGDVVAYLKYVTSNFQALASDKRTGLHFLSDLDELTMDYDAEKLQRVLSNLLSNALKFTPEGGNIYVSLAMKYSWEEKPSAILIKVRDTGAGIPEDKLPHIFDRFFQASEAAQKQGSGLGLALSKEFIKLMGGEIAVRSRAGEGAEFIISLPVSKGQGVKTAPIIQAPPVVLPMETAIVEKNNSPVPVVTVVESSENASLQALCDDPMEDTELPLLLLIEDNPDVMTYLQSCLAKDYRLAIARDGREGVDKAVALVPDLVVSDVMMPVMDGFEVCRFLKNDERTSHVPIILLTAKAGLDSRLEGLELGADAYLAKPFHREELLVQIKNLLKIRLRLQKHYRAVAGIEEEHFPIKLVKQTLVAQEGEDYFVKKTRRAVEAHLDNYEFNVEMLCKEIGMSHSHLHRKLTALTGCSASRFIRQIRLNKAKELLENPELTITAVAFDTGFNDPSYFGRVFKQEFNMTPVEWRERMAGVEN